MRARYGTGVYLKLNKRETSVRIKLTPLDGDYLRVHWKIGGDDHYLYPSVVMGGQFSDFLDALYFLYDEDHQNIIRDKRRFQTEYSPDYHAGLRRALVHWDEEGRMIDISLTRRVFDAKTASDELLIELKYHAGIYTYTLPGWELCYAVGRACTAALKKYGFFGYTYYSGMQYYGDFFDVNKLLFVKAYALEAMELRKLQLLWENPRRRWMRCGASSFEQELELLLFDM